MYARAEPKEARDAIHSAKIKNLLLNALKFKLLHKHFKKTNLLRVIGYNKIPI